MNRLTVVDGESSPRGADRPELQTALGALRTAVKDADNPVGAARAVRKVAARHALEYDTSRRAYRWEAEKLLRPFFGGDSEVAKAIAWMCCDAAWETLRVVR